MRSTALRWFVVTALLIAMVTVATMVIHIPLPVTQGFVNIGDAVILLAATLLGWRSGLLAGGLGSALADLLLGYAIWAPWTLIIKGLEGAIAGLVFSRTRGTSKLLPVRLVGAMGLAVLWMVAGYLIAQTIVLGKVTIALTEVPFNLLQGFVSLILAAALYAPLKRAGLDRIS